MSETRLFVGNIPAGTTENELSTEFGYYGVVKSVELKQKSGEDNLYGFVNIVLEEKLIPKCIREFGQQQFKGNYLAVSKAKESFLERLKREREQQERIGDENSIGRRLIEISMKSYSELETTKETAELPQIQKEVSSDESSSEEEEEVEEVSKVPVKKTITFNTSFKKEEPKVLDKAVLDDMKRQQSLQKLKDLHREKKNAIRNALSSIDSTEPRNNKIVFEKPEPVDEKISSNKPTLFDDDDEEMEVPAESFKLKKQFEGKKGEKLFELQTKFHSDSRFKMDEKFVDDTDEFIDSKKKYAREELKERKRLRKEMINWDQDELKEERDHQLSILESITGQSTGIQHTTQQKPPQKGMLRFDPSKESHKKYLDVVKGDEIIDDDMNDEEVEAKTDEKVGEERYFEVSDNLAEAFKANESSSKPFSIFGMLGINHADDEDEKDDEKVAEVSESKSIKLPTKIHAFQINQARFKYDSSDTDEEKQKPAKKPKKEPQKKSKDGKYTKSGVWRYNFFVCDGDKRLQEAFAFLKKSDFVEAEVLQEKRKKLKKVIKTQVRKARHDKEKSFKKRKV